MRKYQQLLLVVISIISISVLVIYRSENERLNHVLNVINFLGNRDSINLVKIENFSNFTYRFDYPLPSWVNLGSDFHAYSAFWKKNDLVKGGDALALVVASVHAKVEFQCKVHFVDNTIANGKFNFMRVEEEISDLDGASEKFIIYKFLCKVQFDHGKPKNLIFVNKNAEPAEHFVPIRHLTIKDQYQMDSKSLITACVDLNSYNHSLADEFSSDLNVAQYFLHHELIGIRNFIVYNSNTNQMNQHVIDLLTNKFGIRLNVLPYNFPFALSSQTKNRAIIESDCLYRTSGLTKFIMITSIDEYLYPSSKLSPSNRLIKLINQYSNEVSRFEVNSKSVCIDPHRKIHSDNDKYSNDLIARTFYIQKNDYPYNDKPLNDNSRKSVDVDRNFAVVHKYVKCPAKSELYDWRTIMEEEHKNYIDFISKELNKLLLKY